jgi:hypothetical protein
MWSSLFPAMHRASACRCLEREPIGELRPIVTGQISGMKRSAATYPLSALARRMGPSSSETRLDDAGNDHPDPDRLELGGGEALRTAGVRVLDLS